MKKLSVFGTLILLQLFCFAAKWRVNNTPGVDADFTNLEDAHETASPGDTLYIEPSAIRYNGINLFKPLIIIGNGYQLDANPQTQANVLNSEISHLSFDAGSAGSVVSGVFFRSISELNSAIVRIYRSDVTITRCKFSHEHSTSYRQAISVRSALGDVTGIEISGNYIFGRISTSIGFTNGAHQAVIKNNILRNLNLTASSCINANYGSYIVVENNHLKGKVIAYDSEFRNNIHEQAGSSEFTNCILEHNISSSTTIYGTSNGNQSNVSIPGLYTTSGSFDNYYVLNPTSLALNAGLGGADCGAFGGDTPYKLSGLPSVPAIYEFSSTVNNTTQELEVVFSTKSHN